MSAKDAPRGGLASLGLQNRLLEVAVVVGMDQESGLNIRRKNDPDISDDLTLFDYDFQGHLLDILSGPQDTVKSPSIAETNWNTFRRFTSKLPSSRTSSAKPKPLQRGMSVRKLRKQANKLEEVPVSTDFLSNLPMLCMPEDSKVYDHKLEAKIHCTVLTDIDGFRHYASILTFYREFYATKINPKSWSLDTNSKLSPDKISNNNNNNGPVMCYVPCCVCFVSVKPYFSVFKDALSCFHKEFITSGMSVVRKTLEKYVTNLSLVICPPSSLKMRFVLGTLPITLPSPSFPSKQENIVDLDLRLPLFMFMRQPTVLMDVLACIMHEQRIVFLSSNFTLLPLVMECFQCYIRPLEWHHQYIPILFSEIIGFVDCPGIFMMGCHSRHREQIEKIENDLFLVDLDQGTISTNSHSSTETDGGRLGQFALHMPEFAVQNLLKRLRDFQLHNTVSSVCEINPVTLDEIKDHYFEIRQKMNRRIQSIFVEFMIDLFSSTLSFLDHERQQFKGDKFLESINPTDSPFYIKVSKSYMFQRFIKQRLARTTDTFSVETEKRLQRRNFAKNERSRMQSFVIVNHSELPPPAELEKSGAAAHKFSKEVDSMLAKSLLQNGFQEPLSNENLQSDHFSDTIDRRYFGFSSSQPENEKDPQITVQMPTFPVLGTNFNAKHFYQRCDAVLTDTIAKLSTSTSSHSATHRAGLLFLRGLYRLAEEELVNGLKDLHATAKEDARYFPEKIIKKVVMSLNDHELNIIQKNSLYKNVPSQPKARGHRTQTVVTHQMRSFFSDDNTAMYPLKIEPFTFILEKSDITSDEKVISILFEALCSCSDNDTNEIYPDCFNAFYQTWHQLKSDCEKALKSLSFDVHLPPDIKARKMSTFAPTDGQVLQFRPLEQIIKVSPTVQSNKGNGRLVLTTSRLLFISAGNQECKYLIKLEEIMTLLSGKLKNILSSTPALFIIHQKPSAPMKVALKSECDLWLHLINEVKMGRKVSADQRDDYLSLNLAAQNVLLADAFYAAMKDEDFLKPDVALGWVKKLCKFVSLYSSGEVMSFSAETDKMMLMCIDPSPKESKKAGVCTIAYSSAEIDETPHIWVTLSSGKLRLIDTTTWNLDPKPIKEWDTKPNCIQLIKGKELWIGAEDGNIYVLSVRTVKVSRILHDHTEPVIAMIKAKDNLIASATRSGEVIVWDQSTVKEKFNAFVDPVNLVDLVCFKDYLCCCSTIYAVICDYKGHPLQRLEPTDSPRAMNSNLACCTWEENDEIWAGDDHGCISVWDVPECESSLQSSASSSRKMFNELPLTPPKLTGNIYDNTPITSIAKHDGQIWIGNSLGDIVVFNGVCARQEYKLRAHDGPVTCLCPLENRYMASGSGGEDGKIVLWKQLQS